MDSYTQLEFCFDDNYKHYNKPKSDNQKLLNYQYEYKQGSKAALDKIYKLGLKVAMQFIKKEANKNKHIALLSHEDREEKAHNAITYIIMRYISVEGFYIKKSFTGYLFLRVLHELFYTTKIEKNTDLVDYL